MVLRLLQEPNGESFSPLADALPTGVGCCRGVGMLTVEPLRASAMLTREASVFIGWLAEYEEWRRGVGLGHLHLFILVEPWKM